MPKPGDVAIGALPGAVKTKPRPLVVVSTDLYQATRPDLIAAILTTQIARATEPTDYVLQDWAAAGLVLPSAFRAYLGTIWAKHLPIVGRLSDRDWQEVQARLRLALAVT
jgi:mRNA interferase MazF